MSVTACHCHSIPMCRSSGMALKLVPALVDAIREAVTSSGAPGSVMHVPLTTRTVRVVITTRRVRSVRSVPSVPLPGGLTASCSTLPTHRSTAIQFTSGPPHTCSVCPSARDTRRKCVSSSRGRCRGRGWTHGLSCRSNVPCVWASPCAAPPPLLDKHHPWPEA